MRVARGMFRLWLVLSCLWIATVAAIGYSSWPSSKVQQAATSKDPKGGPDNWWESTPELDSSAISVPKAATPVPAQRGIKDASKDDPYAKYLKDDPPNNFAAVAAEVEAALAQESARELAVTTGQAGAHTPCADFYRWDRPDLGVQRFSITDRGL